jgi:tetratricopeptide (TPR) repeat protein
VLREAQIATGPAWASLLLEESYVLWQEGNFEEARQTAHAALNIFEEVQRQQNHAIANAYHSTATSRTLEGDPVDLGRAHRLLASIEVYIGQSSLALDHLNTALAIFEQYDRQREIALVCGDLGDAYLRKAEHTLAQAALRRSLSIAERIGHVSIMSVAFGNLGMLSARLGDLPQAEIYYKRALALAEQVDDPVYISLLHGYLVPVMQHQGKMVETKFSICQALTIGRSMNVSPCIGVALVALGHLRISEANTSQANNSSSPEMTKQRNSTSFTHLLNRARTALQRALTLEGLEAETKTEGQLALAQVSLLLGEIDIAQQQTTHTLEEAHRYDQTWLLASAQHLMGSILTAAGQQEQAVEYFEHAMEKFQSSGMRLEWARTLQSYAVALLEQHTSGNSNYEQGLKYLQDARLAFHECNAILDLQVIEGILARHTSPMYTFPLEG